MLLYLQHKLVNTVVSPGHHSVFATKYFNMLTELRSGYLIVQWSFDGDPSLDDLLEELPELVLGRYVQIASCDSGPYNPTLSELSTGWELTGNIATSPKIKAISDLPTPGFDEWYVYEEKPMPYEYRHFVNTAEFSPLTSNKEELNAFWSQIEATRPLHFIGAGTPNMFLVTRDKTLLQGAEKLSFLGG